jgi:hypothetical protein
MKTIYGLLATGRYDWCDGRHTIVCKKVFTDRQKAVDHIPEFRKRCIEAQDLLGTMRSLVDDETLGIQIVEYDLVD